MVRAWRYTSHEPLGGLGFGGCMFLAGAILSLIGFAGNLREGYIPTVNQDARDLYRSGMEKRDNGDREGALADFTKAIDADPTFVDARLERGVTRYSKGDLDGALSDFDSTIRLRPDDA